MEKMRRETRMRDITMLCIRMLRLNKQIFGEFSKKYGCELPGRVVSPESLAVSETKLKYEFPVSYREYVLEHGATYCPDLLSLIVERELELPDIQEFILVAELPSANAISWSGGMPAEYVAFASDCMGNIFCFNRLGADDIYYFDHDLCEIESLELSFPKLLTLYIEVSNA
jgi:hypothetical protein